MLVENTLGDVSPGSFFFDVVGDSFRNFALRLLVARCGVLEEKRLRVSAREACENFRTAKHNKGRASKRNLSVGFVLLRK